MLRAFNRFVFTAAIAVTIATAGAAKADTNSFTNVRFSPLGLLFGSYGVTADFVVTPEWTVGPSVSYANYKVDSNSASFTKFEGNSYGFGARANWFKNGVFTDGLYVGPAISYSSVKLTTTDSQGFKEDASVNTPNLSALVGYGWFWDNFNIMLGLGLGASLGDNKVTVTDRNGQTTSTSAVGAYPVGEFSLGWTL